MTHPRFVPLTTFAGVKIWVNLESIAAFTVNDSGVPADAAACAILLTNGKEFELNDDAALLLVSLLRRLEAH